MSGDSNLLLPRPLPDDFSSTLSTTSTMVTSSRGSFSGMVGVSAEVLLRAPEMRRDLGANTGVKTGVAPDNLLDLLTGVAGVLVSAEVSLVNT